MQEIAVTITRVESKDLPALREISTCTFRDTFSDSNTPENMEHYLTHNLSDEKLASEWSDPDTEFYFARNAGREIMGYLKLNSRAAQTEPQPHNYLEVERIYVLQQYQGLKIGWQLMEFAFQRARELSRDVVWLAVWEHNIKAIDFYTRIGFIPFSSHIFQLGNDAQTDILMRKSLIGE